MLNSHTCVMCIVDMDTPRVFMERDRERTCACTYVYVNVVVIPCVFMRVDMDSSHPQDWLLMEHVGGPVAYLLDLVYRSYHWYHVHLWTYPVEGCGKHNIDHN